MIRQYIKLFLESREENEENQQSFHTVLDDTSAELDSIINTSQSEEDSSSNKRKSRYNTTMNRNNHNYNSDNFELFMRRRTDRDSNN